MKIRTLTAAVALAAAFIPSTAGAKLAACNWPMYGHDLGRSFGPTPGCARIDKYNVSTLTPKWFFQTDAPVTATPTIVDGMVYAGDAGGIFHAVKTTNGTEVWNFKVTDSNQDAYGRIVSSAAVDALNGRHILAFGGGSTLYLLNARTGAELAQVCLDPRTDPAVRCKGSRQVIEIESSPAIVHRPDGYHILVGMDFNENPDLGRAGLVNVRIDTTTRSGSDPWTLQPMWKFDPETEQTYTGPGALTAGGDGHGCGNLWASPTVDVAAGLVFFGTGNCDLATKPADMPVAGEATWAVSLDSGSLVWRHSPRELNDLDLDYGATPNLLPDGRVGEGGKDGVYVALPRTPSCAAPCDPQKVDWETRVSTASDIGGMIGSTALGYSKGRPAVFATSAIPISTRTGIDPTVVAENPGRIFALHAIDAVTGENLWDAPMPLPSYAAASYSNNVVFLADTFGLSIQAYDADTGLPVWAFPLLGAPSSAPATVGDSIYFGSGTAADPVPSSTQLTGIWSFHLAL